MKIPFTGTPPHASTDRRTAVADRTWANPTAAPLGTIGKPAAISMTGTL
ncbi:hypothetical protein OG311_05995 [Streptomyces sp. NBC_01343]|nr:hypothetical protein OG311_05995 [Streptomyces sp. NBC_01343]